LEQKKKESRQNEENFTEETKKLRKQLLDDFIKKDIKLKVGVQIEQYLNPIDIYLTNELKCSENDKRLLINFYKYEFEIKKFETDYELLVI
jgi:hypothetical protein